MDKFYVLFSCMRWTLVVLMSFCCAYAPLSAQDSVWAVNPHDYQYHMSVYACLQVDGETVWGLTGRVIASLLETGFDRQLDWYYRIQNTRN